MNMSPFTVLVLCIQACLIQSVMSNCCGGNSNRGISYSSSGNNAAISSVSSSSRNCYGGEGKGDVSAVGDIGVCGKTQVVGSVPVLGCVSFSGCTPACGSTTITGQCCGCGCSCL